MKITLEHNGLTYRADLSNAKSIAIKLDFEGPQANHFGAEKASSDVLKIGDFTGDTKSGGSCNVDSLELIPHCNGTHTETVSHIVNEDIWIGHAAMEVLTVAMVVTVKPSTAKIEKSNGSDETYRPALAEADKIITRKLLAASIAAAGDIKKIAPTALIVRTTPNLIDKCSATYRGEDGPPFFTVEAMTLINELGIRHLLVDMPSVDKMYDDGLLTNHHIYWNVAETSHELSAETWQDKTITEMVFVDDEIQDGVCGLNLQVPAFCSDAAPSRPVVFPITQI